MTTLGVECFFKGMRTDHDVPTVPNYTYKRARCVKDDAHLSGGFLIFHWAQFVFPEKIIKGEPPNIKTRPKKQAVIIEETGSKKEDTRREAVMREFDGEYGRGARQENVRSKTK